MKRVVVGAVVFVVMLLAMRVAAQQGFSIAGRIGATDQEAQEGYFAIDAQTMLVVKPGTDVHAYLRGKVGQRVRITIEPERESE